MKTLLSIGLIAFIFSCQQDNGLNYLDSKNLNEPSLFLPNLVTLEDATEFSMAIHPNSNLIFFTRRRGDEKQRIYETKFEKRQWTKPVIASFSTDRDESPKFSADGNTLYFGSARPLDNRPNLGNFDMNIWKTDFVNKKWTAPTPLPAIINKVQAKGEEWPSSNMSDFVTVDDNTFYTGTMQPGSKGLDLYTTTFNGSTFSELKKLPETINLEDKWEYAPVLSPDGNYLLFQVYNRADAEGGDDIFISKKGSNGNWLPSVNLGKIVNTNMNECPIAFSPNGKYFFFTRDKKDNPKDYDGISSIYVINTSALNLDLL